MTESEAIKIIKSNKPTSGYTMLNEALGIAIEALEKQVAKKPDIEGDGYADGHLVYDTWICPCCNKYYEIEYDEYDYCPNCGQRIDFGE